MTILALLAGRELQSGSVSQTYMLRKYLNTPHNACSLDYLMFATINVDAPALITAKLHYLRLHCIICTWSKWLDQMISCIPSQPKLLDENQVNY